VSAGTPAILAVDGGAAPLPRRNGELVFEAPWESRAFGVAIALHDAGAIDFEVFRSRLIAAIGRRGGPEPDGEPASAYYACWLDALERVLLEQRIVSAAELEARCASIAHDWAHDHGPPPEHGHHG